MFTIQRTPTKKRTRPATAATPTPAATALRQQLAQRHPGALDRIVATGEATDDAFLGRWLETRGRENAADAIAAHATWRESFVGRHPLGITEESIADELAAEKVFLQGADRQGCPVLVFITSRHVAGAHSATPTTRLMAYAVDAGISVAAAGAAPTSAQATNPANQVVCIFDMAGVGSKNVDVAFLRGIFELFQAHYPESLRSLYFVNAPFIFWGVWRCVSPFVAPHTRSKIAFLSGPAGQRQLLDAVGPAALPVHLGGSADLVPVEAALAVLRGRACPRRRTTSLGALPGGPGGRLGGLAGGVARGVRAAWQPVVRHVAPDTLLTRATLAHVLLLGLLAALIKVVMVRLRALDLLPGGSSSNFSWLGALL